MRRISRDCIIRRLSSSGDYDGTMNGLGDYDGTLMKIRGDVSGTIREI